MVLFFFVRFSLRNKFLNCFLPKQIVFVYVFIIALVVYSIVTNHRDLHCCCPSCLHCRLVTMGVRELGPSHHHHCHCQLGYWNHCGSNNGVGPLHFVLSQCIEKLKHRYLTCSCLWHRHYLNFLVCDNHVMGMLATHGTHQHRHYMVSLIRI